MLMPLRAFMQRNRNNNRETDRQDEMSENSSLLCAFPSPSCVSLCVCDFFFLDHACDLRSRRHDPNIKPSRAFLSLQLNHVPYLQASFFLIYKFSFSGLRAAAAKKSNLIMAIASTTRRSSRLGSARAVIADG